MPVSAKNLVLAVFVAWSVLWAGARPAWSLTIDLTVPGTSDPWLAGMPAGSTASLGDVAPQQSPVLVPISIVPGEVLTFSATGLVTESPKNPFVGPDGGPFTDHFTGAENGISNANMPHNALLGVFLSGSQPNLLPAPAELDFSTLGTGFVSLAPELQQVFFIGDGLTGTGTGLTQDFIAPAGATRLYLGTMDWIWWFDNEGSFDVRVQSVPEPPSLALFVVILVGAGCLRHRFNTARV